MGHFSFVLALRITVVQKVWVWLGEGPILQNTQIFCDVVGGGGDRGRGVASRHGTHHAAMDLRYPREEEGQRTAGTAPGRKTLLRSDVLSAAPRLL